MVPANAALSSYISEGWRLGRERCRYREVLVHGERGALHDPQLVIPTEQSGRRIGNSRSSDDPGPGSGFIFREAQGYGFELPHHRGFAPVGAVGSGVFVFDDRSSGITEGRKTQIVGLFPDIAFLRV